MSLLRSFLLGVARTLDLRGALTPREPPGSVRERSEAAIRGYWQAVLGDLDDAATKLLWEAEGEKGRI